MNDQKRAITPVILAGGRGVRLRPITSNKRAKPFLKAGAKYSLFQQTLRRAAGLAPPIIVGRAEDEKRILDECAALNITPLHIILEPSSRNTAPAIAVAALSLADENSQLLVMPSDHAVPQTDNTHFTATIVNAANHQGFTVMGITPRKPSRQYGYIISGAGGTAHSFTEKPAKRAAASLMRDHNALWHSGMFMAPACEIIHAFKRHAPDILGAAHFAIKAGKTRSNIIYPDAAEFVKSPAISIDYAILEKQDNLRVQRLDIGWSDVGSISSFAAHTIKNWLNLR